jgi:SAM-dependent methyltransferase
VADVYIARGQAATYAARRRSGRVYVMTPEDQARAEAQLARQLLEAPDAERQSLYGLAYDRIYEMHLPRVGTTVEMQTFGASPRLVPLLKRLTRAGDRVLEVGCGAGLLAIELARAERLVTGVEVSEVILREARRHSSGRVDLHRVVGTGLPFESNTFDFAYSVEVVEHLHERDVANHLAEIRRVLRRGGRYWMLTPNRQYPIDRWGVETDADVHLKEWTYSELSSAMRSVGFVHIRTPWRNYSLQQVPLLPVALKAWAESVPNRRWAKLAGCYACSVVGTAT